MEASQEPDFSGPTGDAELQAVVQPNVWMLSSEEIPPILFTTEEVRLLGIGKMPRVRPDPLSRAEVGQGRCVASGVCSGVAGLRREARAGGSGVSAKRARKANGEGTAYRRADGRWAAQVYVNQSDGRRVRRTFYGWTRKEVERKMADLRDRSERGGVITPVTLTLEAYLKEWLAQIVAVRVRPNTLQAYRYNAERYLVPDLGAKRLMNLSARDLRLYFESLRRRGVGARTIKYVHTTLRAALEDAVREEVIDKNPAKLAGPGSAEG
jgi:Phage integrase, N-terminal SAM-like domain